MKSFFEFAKQAVDKAVLNIRIRNNLTFLLSKIKNEQICNIWTLSSDKCEYERFVNMLSKGEGHKNKLEAAAFTDLLQDKGLEKLQGAPSATLIHNPCNIRKAYSEQMENLDQVIDLKGNIVNGYRTFNSVLLHDDKISLLACRPYSQKEESAQGADHLSNKEVSFEQIRSLSQKLKSDFPERCLTHLFDREADDSEYFEFIDSKLKDLFIFRSKTNRNSDVAYWNE